MYEERKKTTCKGTLLRRTFAVLFILLLSNSISQLLSLPIVHIRGPFEFLLISEATAQSVAPEAQSKYAAGLQAMKKGDHATAKALFKQAIALDAKDRSVRVGMFTTEYHPNQKLKEAEAKSPSSPSVAKVEAPAVPKPPAEAAEKPAVAKVEERSSPPLPTPVKPDAKPQTAEKPKEVEKPKPEFLNHKVYAGETWESIAKWYSGNAARASEIASRNPNLSSKLKGGDVVKIPCSLAIAHNKQSRGSTAPKEPPPAAAAQAQTPSASTTTIATAQTNPAAQPPVAATVPPKPVSPRIEGLPGVFGPK